MKHFFERKYILNNKIQWRRIYLDFFSYRSTFGSQLQVTLQFVQEYVRHYIFDVFNISLYKTSIVFDSDVTMARPKSPQMHCFF